MKIYFGEKALYLADSVDKAFEELMHHPETMLVDEASHHAVHALLHELKKDEVHNGILLHPDMETAKEILFSHFTLIEAAGGVVVNEQDEMLFIKRLGKWDLPKGKMEAGELPYQSAEREIMEETGMNELELMEKIGITYHTYEAYGKHYLKTNHWYQFKGKSDTLLLPQIAEDITEVKWFSREDITIPLANTYPSIRDIIEKFLK